MASSYATGLPGDLLKKEMTGCVFADTCDSAALIGTLCLTSLHGISSDGHRSLVV
jgi:hypothetical protein